MYIKNICKVPLMTVKEKKSIFKKVTKENSVKTVRKTVSQKIKNKTIFKIANNLNNVLIYIIDDKYTQDNETQCKNIFFSRICS